MLTYLQNRWHLFWCILYMNLHVTALRNGWSLKIRSWLFAQSIYESADLWKLDKHASLKSWGAKHLSIWN
jgi:hypothetical protein